MAEVVQHSTQYMTDDDRAAIAHYLKSLPAVQEEPTVSARAYTPSVDANNRNRARTEYEEFCVTCHRSDGD